LVAAWRPFSELPSVIPVGLVLDFLCLALLALAAWSGVVRKGSGLSASGLEIPLAAVAAALLLAVQAASYRRPAWLSLSRWGADVALFCVLLSAACRHRNRLIARALLAAVLCAALFGIDQYTCGWDETQKMFETSPGPFSRHAVSQELRDAGEGRLKMRRAFGPLIYPNTFAALLIVGVALSLGRLPALRKRTNDGGETEGRVGPGGLAIGASVLCCAAIGCAMLMTFSKGGWLACSCAVALWAFLARRELRGLWRAAVAVSVVTLILLGVLHWIGVIRLPRLYRFPLSAVTRFDYWRGAWGVVSSHPWRGVGLGNFADHFFLHKIVTGEETQHAHNELLELWSEAGLLGVVAVLWLGLAFVSSIARGRDAAASGQHASDEERRGTLAAGFAGPAAFLLLTATGQLHWLYGLVLGLIWVAWYSIDATIGLGPRALRWGALAGLAGVLVQASFDFSVHARPVAASVWMLGAFVLSGRGTASERKGPGNRRLLVALGATALCLTHAAGVLLPEVSASIHEAKARELLDAGRLAEAAVEMDRMVRATPHDAARHAQLANVFESLWQTAEREDERRKWLSLASREYQTAIRLRPEWAAYRAWLGEMFEAASWRQPEFLPDATSAFQQAVERYPTNPRYRFQLAMLLGRGGDVIRQRRELQTALAQDEALRVADGPAVLRLDPEQRAQAMRALQGTPQPF